MNSSSGAYLAMLEQTICLKMEEIAMQFPEPHRRRYLDATMKFGLPYCESAIASDVLRVTRV
jgi:hypothetical protein